MPMPLEDDGITFGTPGAGLVVGGLQGAAILFIPSARLPGPQYGSSERKRKRTFCKGYSERVTLETNNSSHWMWRRIVFRYRMLNQVNQVIELDGAVDPYTTWTFRDTTRGQMRVMWNIAIGQEPNVSVRDNLETLLFEGTAGQDWINAFTAKTDSRHVSIVSDITRQVGGAQTDQGRYHRTKRWYPVNRTLVYNDAEDGSTPHDGGTFSDLSKETCGDLCVYDMFSCANGTVADSMRFVPEGTYYWHEG